MFLNDLQQLTDCVTFLVPKISAAEESIYIEYENSTSTTPIRALKSFKLQKAILAVGMFSLLESSLQIEYKGKKPFEDLECQLLKDGELDLLDQVKQYRNAINVLKHGKGRSLEALLVVEKPRFSVRSDPYNDEDSFQSFDNLLVDVDDEFLQNCALTIEEVVSYIHARNDIEGVA